MNSPKHPNIEVRLSGEDGNSFVIIARVMSALRRSGVPKDEIAAFNREAMAGDYDHVLQTCIRWVDVT